MLTTAHTEHGQGRRGRLGIYKERNDRFSGVSFPENVLFVCVLNGMIDSAMISAHMTQSSTLADLLPKTGKT